MNKVIRAQVDYENNSEDFWNAFYERFPELKTDQDTFQFTEDQWEEVVNLPGWVDPNSPAYAPHPLLILEE